MKEKPIEIIKIDARKKLKYVQEMPGIFQGFDIIRNQKPQDPLLFGLFAEPFLKPVLAPHSDFFSGKRRRCNPQKAQK